MSERFRLGLDMTTKPPSVYLIADGHHFYFANPREANELIVQGQSTLRLFLHNTLFDREPGDRQILQFEK